MHGAAVFRTFRDDDNATVLCLAETPADELFQLVHVGLVFRDNGGFGSRRDRAVLCQETGIAPHDLDKEDALVRGGRIADLVHTFHDGVQGRIVSDGRICPAEVIVYRARQADADNVGIFIGKQTRPRQGTVSADNDQVTDIFLF